MSDLLLQPSITPSSLIAKKGALLLKKQKLTEFVLSAGFVADIFCLCFDFRYNFIVVFAGEHSTWLSERRSRVILIVILFFRHLHLKFLKLRRRRYWTTSLIRTRADIWLTTWKLCHMRNVFPSTPLVQLFFGKKTT